MWECPTCGRSFKNTNQSHYCSKADSIDEYIKRVPPEHREILQSVRETIKKAAPDCIEKISWGMPTFYQGENLIHFAVHKTHLGLYPGDEAVVKFKTQLDNLGLIVNKGTIQIPFSIPMPYKLLTDITKYRVKQAKK